MKNDYPTAEQKNLFKAIKLLKNPKEAAIFFRDLCTIKELDDLAKRWQQAGLLFKGKQSYEEIAKITKASTTTVTRTAHWLKHGMGGYRLILSRLFPKK